MKTIKSVVKKLIFALFKALGSTISLKFVKVFPRFKYYLPRYINLEGEYLNGLKIKVDTSYPIELDMLIGTYEPESIAVVRKLVKDADTCIDIGANVGAITLALAQAVGNMGTVYALEPGNSQFSKLESNLLLNKKILNVHPFKLALSNKQDRLFLNEDPENLGNASLGANSGDSGEVLDTITLDDFINSQGVNKIDFIKIDVEGMELKVIQGAMESIKKFKPTIYYETLLAFENNSGEKPLLEIENLLKEIGYKFYKLHDDTLQTVSYPNLDNNTIAISPLQ